MGMPVRTIRRCLPPHSYGSGWHAKQESLVGGGWLPGRAVLRRGYDMESNAVKPKAPTGNDDFFVSYHVVCLIDLLGQKEKLANWAKLPPDLQPTPEFIHAIKQTAGTIVSFQEQFEEFFHQCDKPDEWVEALSQDEKNRYYRYRECRLITQQFSDTFVFYAPMPNSHKDVSVFPLRRILSTCCWLMTRSLAAGIPLRGAICIGTGMELAERNFYGPALAEAHYLESKVTKYPRILISTDAAQFAQGNAGFSQNVIIETMMKELAIICRSLLCRDVDGKVIVDFLGQGAFDYMEEVDLGYISWVEKAYRFVKSETLRFQQEKNEKLAPRYAALQEYMEARLSIWGLQSLKSINP